MHTKLIIDLSNVPAEDLEAVKGQLSQSLSNRAPCRRKPLTRHFLVRDMHSLSKAIRAIHTTDAKEKFTGDRVDVCITWDDSAALRPEKKQAETNGTNATGSDGEPSDGEGLEETPEEQDGAKDAPETQEETHEEINTKEAVEDLEKGSEPAKKQAGKKARRSSKVGK